MPDAEIIPFPVRPVNKLASDMALVYDLLAALDDIDDDEGDDPA